jgi:hypothetical protein
MLVLQQTGENNTLQDAFLFFVDNMDEISKHSFTKSATMIMKITVRNL